jgi:hypothetical protein
MAIVTELAAHRVAACRSDQRKNGQQRKLSSWASGDFV